MKFTLLLPLLLLILAGCTGKNDTDPGTYRLFDTNWLFYPGDLEAGANPETDDSGWRKLDLPHDWSIENIPGTDSPFDSTVENGVSSGFTRGGTGWYRKHFRIDPNDKGKRVRVLFEGIYMNSDIWLNGKHVGSYFYGYSSFYFDITEQVNFRGDNILAVRVRNDKVRCRWYSGSGIYRHVWLSVCDPLNIETWGLSVITPEVSAKQALVKVSTSIINQYTVDHQASLRVRIIDPENNVVATGTQVFEADAEKTCVVEQEFTILQPALWDLSSPVLYRADAEVILNGKLADKSVQHFGIRSISFDAQNGFQLNSKSLELKGGCIHHDNGSLGARSFNRAEERKVELLKSAGFNAIRFAHNPPSPAILDACDRLGMLAIDESFDVWRYGHFEGDYGTCFDSLWTMDIDHMVRRDRNHPAIIMWSIGNEIVNTLTDEIAVLCGVMADHVRSIDPTRPVTAATNQVSDAKDPYLSHLDVCGYNYSAGQYEPDHERHPERIVYGSESFAIEAYDYWKKTEDLAWVIGDFVWTAFDHIGEASIGWRGYPQEADFYPWNLAYCGDFDIMGQRRPQSYYRQTIWDENPVVSLFIASPVPSFKLNPKKEYWSVWDWPDVVANWNFPGYEGKPLKVAVYSQCDEVELFINERSLGIKTNSAENKNMIYWEVPYEAGKLKAVGYVSGKKATESELVTAGEQREILLTPDRNVLQANGQDLSFIIVELIDEEGRLNPVADKLVTFEISGPGKLAAVASANPTSTESFQLPRRTTWRGQCMVIVQSGTEKGELTVTARSEGLPDKEIIIGIE